MTRLRKGLKTWLFVNNMMREHLLKDESQS